MMPYSSREVVATSVETLRHTRQARASYQMEGSDKAYLTSRAGSKLSNMSTS